MLSLLTKRKRSELPSLTIAVDFDGTLAYGAWPFINERSKWNDILARWLVRQRDTNGDTLLLWTCRENYGGVNYPDGEYLDMAVAYCGEHKLFFSGINVSKGETVGEYQLGSGRFGRKIVADVYIDDRSLPFSPNGFLSGLKWRIYLWMLGRRMRRMRIAKQG
jgi:hypothetical protein